MGCTGISGCGGGGGRVGGLMGSFCGEIDGMVKKFDLPLRFVGIQLSWPH